MLEEKLRNAFNNPMPEELWQRLSPDARYTEQERKEIARGTVLIYNPARWVRAMLLLAWRAPGLGVEWARQNCAHEIQHAMDAYIEGGFAIYIICFLRHRTSGGIYVIPSVYHNSSREDQWIKRTSYNDAYGTRPSNWEDAHGWVR